MLSRGESVEVGEIIRKPCFFLKFDQNIKYGFQFCEFLGLFWILGFLVDPKASSHFRE
jgi:hypothetical protein